MSRIRILACQDCGRERSDPPEKDWSRGRCSSCYQKWYRTTPQGITNRETSRNRLYKRALEREYAYKRLGCTDCGELDQIVLQFDHLPEFEKSGAVASFRHSPGVHTKELEKCEVVCANCHVRRSYERGQWHHGRKAWKDEGGGQYACS